MFKLLYSLPGGASLNTAFRGLDRRARTWTLRPIGIEGLILASSLYFSIFSNNAFWTAVSNGRDWTSAGTWGLVASLFLVVTALHSLLLGIVVNRWTARPVLVLLFIVNAIASYYMQHYRVFLDPTMLRNVIHSDQKEARELLSFALVAHLLVFGILPGVLVMRMELIKRPFKRAVLSRAGLLLGCVIVSAAGIALAYQDLASLMRNQKEVRYLITPGNYLVSASRVFFAESADARKPKIPVGTDAALAASWENRRRPALLVIVVGETARAANWGMNGYTRQTTPELARTGGVLNFSHVSSCGTNTEVSVPCMFSPFGRKDYDEDKIRQHESLLHVLEHGGFKTIWRDNQSGCKGVCDGLEQQSLSDARNASLCDGERCLDEILLDNLEAEVAKSKKNVVVVLHQLGNHGPAYSRRYPDAFKRFTPTCDSSDLGKCSQQQIVNSYDNALLYTDHFLEQTIERLKRQTSHDAAMIYVSDHGESLGEKGFYLHGLPYTIAPKEQTEVPMVMWMSPRFESSFSIDAGCMKQRTSQPVSHDYLFHTVLGMLQVTTGVYDKAYDLTAPCRG